MSNITYLPWVSPDSDVPTGGSSEESAAVPPTPTLPPVLDLDDELQRLDALVLRKLASGDMSSGEVQKLLIQQGLPELDTVPWLERYARLGYVNDDRVAESLARSLSERKGKGRGAIAAEMRRRLLPAEVCARVLADFEEDDELERATELAVARARQLERYDRDTAERRLVGFLSRRGYGGSVVRTAVKTALDGPLDD